MTTLTRRQQQVLDFIRETLRTYGHTPTYREIGVAFDIDINAVNGHLKALVRKGCILIHKRLARGIVLLDGTCPCCGQKLPTQPEKTNVR
jgi:repressor LexA